jgi:hypothetical protein
MSASARQTDSSNQPPPADDGAEYRLRVTSEAPATPGALFRDDFVLACSADEAEYPLPPLAPPEGFSPTERRLISTEPRCVVEEEDEPQRPLTQYTLRELMSLTTFLSVGLALVYYLPAHYVAGVLGILSLVGQGLLMRFPPENRHVKLAAGMLLIMYAVSLSAAFIQHFYSGIP